jgi:hypothetical protein
MSQEKSPEVKTIFGIFSNNKITDAETGEISSCITYGSVRKVIENKLAFLNLYFSEEIGCWIIYQYILV